MEYRDLKKQYWVLKHAIDKEIEQVCTNASFIGGAPVRELEQTLAEYVGVRHCITCGNGTDALTLALKAWGIGPGDAVFVPDFTFFASAESPAAEGATPIFVDVRETTYNMDPEKLEGAILAVQAEGSLRPRVVVAVDLFGLPAEYEAISRLCKKYNLLLLEDGAQGFGGALRGKRACSYGDISTTSFFPAKPLGCYGDGGAIFTDNDEWAAQIRSLCVHGKNGDNKYDNRQIGLNSRLDTIQAAILKVKFRAFRDSELEAVNAAARTYTSALKNSDCILPTIADGYKSSWAQYTVQLPKGIVREKLRMELKDAGIPTMVYYMKPLHRQTAFAQTRSASADCPVTDRICECVLSLPLHPYIKEDEIFFIAEKLQEACKVQLCLQAEQQGD